MQRFALFALVCLLASWLAGCSSDPLDAQTALSLMRERQTDPLTISFSASRRAGESDPKIQHAYDQLVEGHVLDCKPNGTVGTLCQAGPAGDAITQSGSTDLSLIAGHWVPSAITKIDRSGRNGSTAEARLIFEPSQLYKEYQEAFDIIQNSTDGRVALAQQKDGKNAQATFVHSEDGWHIERLQ